jgi:hypothetical protein
VQVLGVLDPVKEKFPTLSFADLIVIAGTTALDDASPDDIEFGICGGRSDALDGEGTAKLAPRSYVNASVALKDNAKVMGLTPREYVALAGVVIMTSLVKDAVACTYLCLCLYNLLFFV